MCSTVYLGAQRFTYTETLKFDYTLIVAVVESRVFGRKKISLIVFDYGFDNQTSEGKIKTVDFPQELKKFLDNAALKPSNYVFVAPADITKALESLDNDFRTVTVPNCDSVRAKSNELFWVVPRLFSQFVLSTLRENKRDFNNDWVDWVSKLSEPGRMNPSTWDEDIILPKIVNLY